MQDDKAMTHADDRIKSALKSLLCTKPFKAITIQDICNESGLSRKTFSKHFTSKEDVVAAQMHDDFVAPVRALRALLPMDEIKSSTSLMLEKTHITMYENKDYYLSVTKGCGMAWFIETYTEQSYRLNLELYEERGFPAEEVDFVAHYYAASQAMVFEWWLSRGMDVPPKQVAKMMNTWGFAHWREIEENSHYWHE